MNRSTGEENGLGRIDPYDFILSIQAQPPDEMSPSGSTR